MTNEREAGEQLLKAWLQLSSALWNTRMVTGMTFNEAQVCHLILQGEKCGERMTATMLCERTQMLKSQMNRILTKLESCGYISRTREQSDRRRAVVEMTDAGRKAYCEEHENVMKIVTEIVSAIGVEDAQAISDGIGRVVRALSALRKDSARGKVEQE